jgi:hypothetical protein
MEARSTTQHHKASYPRMFTIPMVMYIDFFVLQVITTHTHTFDRFSCSNFTDIIS